MAILLTGGTGKTSVRLARLLQDAKVPFLLASRRGESAAPSGMPAVKFDWLDSQTWGVPFQYKFPDGEKISAVYMMVPIVDDPETSMNAFIDYAKKEHGVSRFVLIAGTSAEPGKAGVGMVWKHFLDIGVEYCVLRPTWFMENLSEEAQRFLIKDTGKIYTACGDGKVPFISTTDIAAVAFKALTDKKSHNTDHTILGPELLTYDQVAEKISNALGRKVEHVKLTEEQRYQGLVSAGLSDYYAKFLTSLEVSALNGAEDRMNDVVEKVTGRPPRSFDGFAQENKAVWQ
ncbi:hypothetical protein MMC30_008820 [Trapelia coarctata]|nr:hypothetical protein [Trapelia coarctata]